MLKLTAKYVPAADEVYRLQNLRTGIDPECRLFQKFAEVGHSRQPGASRQGTYCVTPSGMLLGSINSNDPGRIADLLEKSLTRWNTLKREERLLPGDPAKLVADIQRPERFYPKNGLVLNVSSRDLPEDKKNVKPGRRGWLANAWNQDFAWFTQNEVRQFVPTELKVGKNRDLPRPILYRIACAHLVDNVRGQTWPFEENQVKKARLTLEVTAVEGDAISLRLEGETRTEVERPHKHGLEMRLLGKATYDRTKQRFVAFEMVAVGSRWGGTQFNVRHGDAEGPIGVLFTLAGDGPCERLAPAFSYHAIYGPVVAPK